MMTQDPPQDKHMREGIDFDTNAGSNFVRTKFKENPRKKTRRVLENTLEQGQYCSLSIHMA